MMYNNDLPIIETQHVCNKISRLNMKDDTSYVIQNLYLSDDIRSKLGKIKYLNNCLYCMYSTYVVVPLLIFEYRVLSGCGVNEI